MGLASVAGGISSVTACTMPIPSSRSPRRSRAAQGRLETMWALLQIGIIFVDPQKARHPDQKEVTRDLTLFVKTLRV